MLNSTHNLLSLAGNSLLYDRPYLPFASCQSLLICSHFLAMSIRRPLLVAVYSSPSDHHHIFVAIDSPLSNRYGQLVAGWPVAFGSFVLPSAVCTYPFAHYFLLFVACSPFCHHCIFLAVFCSYPYVLDRLLPDVCLLQFSIHSLLLGVFFQTSNCLLAFQFLLGFVSSSPSIFI